VSGFAGGGGATANATETTAGLMSAADKTKLDGLIPSGTSLLSLGGLTTTAMTGGQGTLGYFVAGSASTISPTDGGDVTKCNPVGVYEGTSGQASVVGTSDHCQFTTDGGAPVEGSLVYVAMASADGGTGAGKFTSTPPVAVAGNYRINPVPVGRCRDASNYASLKTARVELQLGGVGGNRPQQPTDVYWDPVSGLDTASGANGFPVKTWERVKQILFASAGAAAFLYTLIPLFGGVTVHLLSAQPVTSDKVDFPFVSAGIGMTGGALTVVGTPTVVRSGTFTAITPRVRSPIASATGWQLTDSAIANNGWTANVDQLVVDTTQNLSSFVDYDLSLDGLNQTFQSQEWFIATDAGLGATYGTPQVGDTYVVYSLPRINVTTFGFAGNAAVVGTIAALNINRCSIERVRSDGDIDLNGGLAGQTSFFECVVNADLLFSSTCGHFLWGCRICKAVIVQPGANVSLYGTWICMNTNADDTYPLIFGNLKLINDCGITSRPGYLTETMLRIAAGGNVQINGGGLAVFNANNGINVQQGGSLQIVAPAVLYGGFGQRKSIYQFVVKPNGVVTYPVGVLGVNTFCINHTGAHDFELGITNGLGCCLLTNGTIDNTRTLTIAHLDANISAGGFGGNAWDILSGARVVQAN
jgi:hypothetical protein